MILDDLNFVPIAENIFLLATRLPNFRSRLCVAVGLDTTELTVGPGSSTSMHDELVFRHFKRITKGR